MTVVKGFLNIHTQETRATVTRYQNALSLNDSHFVKSRSIYTGSGYGTGISLTLTFVLLV